MMDHIPIPQQILAANQEALGRLFSAEPVLTDVISAGEAIAGLGEHMILHAGPPIGWEQMCGPMRGAIAGVAVYEGWADDLEQAKTLASAGEFEFQPNHHCGHRTKNPAVILWSAWLGVAWGSCP